MAARVIQGDVFTVLPTLERGSVDVCVTSPPYWKLRSYLPKDHPLKALELGSEPTPAAFVANLVRVFGLVREAMADHATLWCNIGDTYSSKPPGCKGVSESTGLHGGRISAAYRETLEQSVGQKQDTTDAVREGNLCLIPQRLAIALQDDGWLVRSVVIWHKPSAMPASLSGWMWKRHKIKVKAGGTGAGGIRGGIGQVGMWDQGTHYMQPGNLAEWADCPGCRKCEKNGGLVLRRGSWRPTSSYEPVLMLAKTDRYYADGIAVQTPAAQATLSRDRYTRVLDDPDEQYAVAHDHETDCGGAANLRDVWTISSEPLRAAHYAAFPTALVSNCLRAGTSARGYCPRCSAPWCRVVEHATGGTIGQGWNDHEADLEHGRRFEGSKGTSTASARAWQNGDYRPGTTLDWRPSCSCDAGEPRPGRVLDPFCGSGRTGLEAQRLGLDFTGIELHPDYASLSQRLLREDMPLFNREDAPAAGREGE